VCFYGQGPRRCGEFAKGKLLVALSRSGEGKGREWGGVPGASTWGREKGGSGQRWWQQGGPTGSDAGATEAGGALMGDQGRGWLAGGLACGWGLAGGGNGGYDRWY
jgi:hypothetical protein